MKTTAPAPKGTIPPPPRSWTSLDTNVSRDHRRFGAPIIGREAHETCSASMEEAASTKCCFACTQNRTGVKMLSLEIDAAFLQILLDLFGRRHHCSVAATENMLSLSCKYFLGCCAKLGGRAQIVKMTQKIANFNGLLLRTCGCCSVTGLLVQEIHAASEVSSAGLGAAAFGTMCRF